MFPYAVKNVLRGTDGLGPIADTLPRAELEWVLRSEHPPLVDRDADHRAAW